MAQTQIDSSIPLAAKQFQGPDLEKSMTSAYTMGTMMANVEKSQADARDNALMSQVLQQIDPNDPNFDDKAISALHDAGVNPTKVLTFKSTLLDQQKKAADVDLQKANAKEKWTETIAKADDNTFKQMKNTNQMIVDVTGDVTKTYDAIMAKGGPGAAASANAAAQQLYYSHIKALVDDPTLPDNIKKVVAEQAKQPFDINKIKTMQSTSAEHQALLKEKEDQLNIQKTQQEIKRSQDLTAIEGGRLAEERRHNKADEASQGKQIVTSVGPDGKPVFTVIDKATGTAKETTEVAVPKGQAGAGGREATMLGRQLNSLAEGTKALENISEIPAGSSTSFFGNYDPGHTLAGTALKNTTNALTGDDAKSYQVLTAGLSRSAATMETGGLAPAGTLTKQLHDAIEIQSTDSKFVAMRKLAEARQILEEPIKNLKANPSLTPDQKAEVAKFETRLQQAIPYTQHDLTAYSQKGKNTQTFDEYRKQEDIGTAGKQPTKSLDAIFGE
jgi:hypothetical protein